MAELHDPRVQRALGGARTPSECLPTPMEAICFSLSITVKPEQVAAVVAFYGTAEQVDYSGTQAAYLGHYAAVDEWEPIDEVRRTQEALRAAGCEVGFHTYLGVGHWFFEEDRVGHYDAEAARLAWKRTIEFLRTRLGQT
jgi:dienelactone hydrolase